MVKKKQSGELKSIPMPLQVQRYKELSALRAGAKTYWNTDHLQPFFPPIETLFKTNELENAQEYGIKFDDQVKSITSKDTIITASGPKKVHIKSTMLLSPFKWMRGDYSTALGLSTTQEQASVIHHKLQSQHNAAYVGALFSAVFSQTKCIHFPKVYGVFSGISRHHTVNISDDYEDLMEKPWFSQNIGQTFELKLSETLGPSPFQHTRSARKDIELGETMTLDGIEELPGIEAGTPLVPEMKRVFGSEEEEEDIESDTSSVSTSYIMGAHSCDCDEKDDDVEEGEDEDGFAWATFTNVPIQYTIMEQCEGTLYELMMKHPEEEKHLAWMSQIIFALLFVQKTFGFVHNDLHSNNVMYVSTDKEFLYYKVGEKQYKVPTYGYIIKIIDFERGTGSIRVQGMKEPKFFMSDHFAVNDEAGGQYNMDPFYVQKFPIIKPNPSFDLVRLATSLFWDLFPKGPDHDYISNRVFQLLINWLRMDEKKYVLFSDENPRHERYHGFNLYKAIARYCKDTAIPRKEIEDLPFVVSSVPLSECLCIDV
jgi:hypothetical protein